MPTGTDERMGPVVTRMLEKFGSPVVFREMLGTYNIGGGKVVSFSGTTISASATDDSINWPSPGDFVAQGVAVDGWILITGFLNFANNGWAQVVSVTAAKVVVDKALTTEAAGRTIGVRLSTDHATKGYVSEWSQRDWNGSTIQPTDGMVITDLQSLPSDFKDRTNDFIFFDGADPATAKRYEIPAVKAIRTGELAPLGMVGFRK